MPDVELTYLFLMLAWIYFVPVIAVVLLVIACVDRTHPRRWFGASLVFAVLWIPMLGNFLGLWLTMWPIPNGIIRSGVELTDYRVEFVTNGIYSDASEYFDIIRSDGKYGFVSIDGDANACHDFHTRQEGSRVYFVCNNDASSSYVDIEQGIVFADWQERTTRLADLEYTDEKPD